MKSKWRGVGLALVALVFDALSMYRTGWLLHSRALKMLERDADDGTLAQASFFMAIHTHTAGRWREGLPYYERASELSWRAGEMRLWAALTANLVQHLYSLGDRKWMDLIAPLMRGAVEIADRQAKAWALSMTAIRDEHLGNHEAALGALDQAIRVYEAVPDHRFLAQALGMRSTNLLRLGRLDEALECAGQASELITAHSLSGTWCTRPLVALAEARLLLFEQGRSSEASVAQSIKRMARQGQRVRDEGAVEAHRLAGAFEWARGRPKAAAARWTRGLEIADELGATHAKARVLAERGRRIGNVEDVRIASTLFAETAAEGELRQLPGSRQRLRGAA